jgi:hypothetical protein
MKNIHVLPTEKPSRLFKHNLEDNVLNISKHLLHRNYGQNIYITSDEEIKEGDWYINNGHLLKCTEVKKRSSCRKIILTTDQDLIKDGVQAIDDDFLEWFVKNSSCEFVDVEVDEYRDTSISDTEVFIDYKIIIPKEEPKQETLEEVAERILFENTKNVEIRYRGGRDSVIKSMLDIAKWQKEQDKKLYSEEEVRNIVEQTIEKFYKHRYVETKSEMKELWLEQFKKK